IGLQLAAPDPDWRRRPDMNEYATPGVRASIVARARFIDDLVTEQADHGVEQYVLLGAGLDTFAQRRPKSLRGSRSSRSTSRDRRHGSGSAWLSSASAFRSGYGWCRSTSNPHLGGMGYWPTALTRTNRPLSRRSAYRCTSPGRRRRRHCAKARLWRQVPRWP